MKIALFAALTAIVIIGSGLFAIYQENGRLKFDVIFRESENRILQEELRALQARVPIRTYEEGVVEATLRAGGPDGVEHARSYTEGYHAAITQFGAAAIQVGGKWPEDTKETKKNDE